MASSCKHKGVFMIEIRKLKQLIQLMRDNELSELDLRDKDQQVTLKRGPSGGVAPMVPVMPPQAAVPAQGSSSNFFQFASYEIIIDAISIEMERAADSARASEETTDEGEEE